MKKLLGILFLSCCLLGTTGCMRMYKTLTVNSNGTITQTDKVGISKEYLEENNGQPEEGAVLETLEDGREILITGNHPVYLPKYNVYREVKDLIKGDYVLVKN